MMKPYIGLPAQWEPASPLPTASPTCALACSLTNKSNIKRKKIRFGFACKQTRGFWFVVVVVSFCISYRVQFIISALIHNLFKVQLLLIWVGLVRDRHTNAAVRLSNSAFSLLAVVAITYFFVCIYVNAKYQYPNVNFVMNFLNGGFFNK